MRQRFTLGLCLFLGAFLVHSPAYSQQSDKAIRQAIIQESIANYSGNCPCPYNSASNGSSCGKRSAYSRVGGESPLCYDNDVTDEMVREYKQQHNIH